MEDISHKQNIYAFLHARGVIHCLKPACCQLPAKQPSIMTAFHSSQRRCLRFFASTLSAWASGYTAMYAGCIVIISEGEGEWVWVGGGGDEGSMSAYVWL